MRHFALYTAPKHLHCFIDVFPNLMKQSCHGLYFLETLKIYFIRMFEKIFWFFYSILLFYAGYLSSRKIWKEYSRHLISGRFEVITSFNFLIGGSISRLVAFLSDNFKEDFKKSPARNLEWVISWTHQT